MRFTVSRKVGRQREGRGDWTNARPSSTIVDAALDPASPCTVAFHRSAAENGPVAEHQRLGADRAVEPCRQVFHGTPACALVTAVFSRRRPYAGRCPEFVVEPQKAVGGVE